MDYLRIKRINSITQITKSSGFIRQSVPLVQEHRNVVVAGYNTLVSRIERFIIAILGNTRQYPAIPGTIWLPKQLEGHPYKAGLQ